MKAAVHEVDRTPKALIDAVDRNQSILLNGPPGVGKTMLARLVVSFMPNMTNAERDWVNWTFIGARILTPKDNPINIRPFRAPHHTVSAAAMAGRRVKACRRADLPVSEFYAKGNPCLRSCQCNLERFVPGELHLANAGVLFLDDVTEFRIGALDAVRGARRTGRVAGYPTRFLLAGSALPCPCGWHGRTERACTCSPGAIARHVARIPRDLFDVEISM